MSTNIIRLGGKAQHPKKQNAIRLVKYLREDHVWKDTKDKASNFQTVELLCEDYADGWSLLFAYNDDRDKGILFLGFFNDGIV